MTVEDGGESWFRWFLKVLPNLRGHKFCRIKREQVPFGHRIFLEITISMMNLFACIPLPPRNYKDRCIIPRESQMLGAASLRVQILLVET